MNDPTTRDQLRERLEAAIELPLLVLSVAMVPIIIVPLVVDLPGPAAVAVDAADWAIWAVFAVQFVVRLGLARRRLAFIRREWLDLVIIVVPFLRPLRVVRSARALRLLRVARLGVFLGEADKWARRLLLRHQLHYVALVAGAVLLAAAGLIYAIEHGDGSGIESFGDAVWWALTTVTTVGYGDMYPLTPAGRAIGAFLMLTGIALFGVVTANVAALFVESAEQERDRPDDRLDELVAGMRALQQEIVELRAQLEQPTT